MSAGDDQPDAASVHAQFTRVLDALEEKLPQVAVHLDAAKADILAFTAFPKAIWRQIWPSNPQERLNREIRRRAAPVPGGPLACFRRFTGQGWLARRLGLRAPRSSSGHGRSWMFEVSGGS